MLEVLMLGIAAGSRTMTPVTVLCWAAWLGFLPQEGWTSWANSLAAVVVLSLCAVGEYVVDVLPQTPSRRRLPLVLARVAFGIAAGVLGWRAVHEPTAGGVVGGLVGALIGTFGGYRLRIWGARRLGRDLPAGLLESALALGISVLVAYRLHRSMIHPPEALLNGLQHAVQRLG